MESSLATSKVPLPKQTLTLIQATSFLPDLLYLSRPRPDYILNTE